MPSKTPRRQTTQRARGALGPRGGHAERLRTHAAERTRAPNNKLTSDSVIANAHVQSHTWT
eukprot:893885-Alexandrium_andersonii.AAC.1